MPERLFEPPSAEQLSSEEREIAALFRSAGAGDRVADDELPAIKATAREAWRRQVRHTAARRGAARAAVAIAAAIVLTIAVALMRRPPHDPVESVVAARLEAAVGDARLGREHAAANAEVVSGATITTGDSGRAALLLAGGHSVRIDVASSVRVVSGRSLHLDHGAIYVDAMASAAPGSSVEVDTPLGVVTDVGTRFEVRLVDADAANGADPGAAKRQALEVRVRDGAVRLVTGAATYDAEAGSELRLEPGGKLDRVHSAPYGDDWRWVESVRPPLAIEGITCEAFLDWAARESGRRWSYTDPGSSGAADALVHGSIEGLTVDEALDTVLPSCGLRHRVAAESLMIESDGG